MWRSSNKGGDYHTKVTAADGAGENLTEKPPSLAITKEGEWRVSVYEFSQGELDEATEWEKDFAYLVKMKNDAIAENFTVYSTIVHCASSFFVIIPGLVASIWVGVTELYEAFYAPNEGYLLGYATGPASFTLALGIILVPSVLKGGLFRKSLHQDRLDTTSYYEILDVLLKDILYVWRRDDSDDSTTKASIVIKDNKTNDRRMNEVVWWVRIMNCFILFSTIAFIGVGVMLFMFSNKLYHRDDPNVSNALEDFQDFIWEIQWFSVTQTISYTVTAFIMTTAVTTLYLAAFLHRKHTELFVRALRKYRRPQAGQEDTFSPVEFRKISEKYLMLQHLFQKSSTCWSYLLTAWIILPGTLFIMGAIVTMVVHDVYMKQMAITMSAFAFTFCLIPVILLAYANGFVDQIIGTVQQATWEDFIIIGGRDRWLEYVKTNPTYWYTLGYAITKAWVLGFISGALSTFGAVAIERLASAD